MPSLFSLIKGMTMKPVYFFLFIYTPLGQLINYYHPFKNFSLYQLLFGTAVILATWTIKNFFNKLDKFKTMTASHPMKLTVSNFYSLVYSKWTIPGLIIVSSLFIYSTISLNFIKLDIIGIYSLVVIVIIMMTAIICQTIYIYYLILLYRLGNSNDFNYSFYFPAKTDWLVFLVKMGRQINNSFFILGFIYTLVYFLNLPITEISFNKNFNGLGDIVNGTSNNLIFVVSWITIFIIIIIAFPIYSLIQRSLTRSLVRKMKNISIEEIEQIMKMEKIKKAQDIESQLKYYTLMNNIDNSSNLPIPRNNLIPIVSSISTISVHIIKISESFS